MPEASGIPTRTARRAFVVVLWPPGLGDSTVVLGQELIVEPAGQDAQNLDRVVRVVLTRRLCRHASILPQRTDRMAERRPAC
jgi:hypothetical protein